LLVADKSSKTFRPDGGAKGFEFGARALGGELDAAVGQVAHTAGDFKTGGDGLDGVTKPNALHAAGIKNIQAAAVGGRSAGWRWHRHGRMKPKSAARRNVFCRAAAILFFLLNLFDRLKNLT
jgi:hypothetical protein